jgi:glutamate synthase (NADPH/NADH) large chain
VATQDPELRKKFSGKPEFVENFFRFLAEEVRGLLAELGFRTVDDMVGRVDMLDMKPAVDHWKASGVDLANVLHPPAVTGDAARHQTHAQDHGLDDILDRQIIAAAWPAIEGKRPVNCLPDSETRTGRPA